MPAEKKKAPALPPKPSTFSDEQWVVAHSAAKLLELLAAPEKSAHAGNSKGGEKPLASKQLAALWLCQLLGSSADAVEEAFKAGAVETCAKLVNSHSGDHAIVASLLGAITHLANRDSSPQAAQIREAIMTVRPAVVPTLLSQLEQSSISNSPAGTALHSSTSAVAAALGLLAVLVSSPDTRLRVTKLMAGWNMKPLIAALASQKALPLEGGRHAAADAAAILATICSPAAAPAAPEAAGGASKGSKKGGKDEGGKKQAAAVPAGDPVDPSLTAAVQEQVLAADGITGLVRVCAAVGSPAVARTSAATALEALMAAHGKEDHVKAEFVAAGGIPTMLKLMMSTTLPLPARAAAAGCIWHYLTPLPADGPAAVTLTAEPGTASAAATSPAGNFFASLGPAAGNPAAAAAAVAAIPSPRGALNRPVTSQEARNNLIAAAKTMRKQQKGEQAPEPSSNFSSSGARTAGNSMSGARSSVRTSVATAAAGAASSNADGPSPEDQAAAAAAAATASYQASLAAWDAAALAGLTARADQVVRAGCVPALMLLCCGPEGPPPRLLAEATAAAKAAAAAEAAEAGAAAADGTGSASPAAAVAAGGGPEMNALGSNSMRAGAKSDLTAIAEPSQGELEGAEDAEDAESEAADPTAGSGAAAGGSAGKKKGKKGKKGSMKVDPTVQLAQSNASAALKLLALSGDAGRTALQDAGAKAVLVPLLAGPAALARWNARQALMSMALTPSSKPATRAVSAKGMPTAGNSGNIASMAAGSSSSKGVAWLIGSEPVAVPDYIAMNNVPASHYQRSAPISQVPMPVLPVIPGKQRSTDHGNTGAAGATPGSPAAGSGRPGSSTQRRRSISNLAGQITAANRVSVGGFYNSTTAVGDGQGTALESSAAGGTRAVAAKSARGSAMVASSAAPPSAGTAAQQAATQ